MGLFLQQDINVFHAGCDREHKESNSKQKQLKFVKCVQYFFSLNYEFSWMLLLDINGNCII